MKILLILFLFPCFLFAQIGDQGNDQAFTVGPFPTGAIVVDSFKVISKVKCHPQFLVSIDSLTKKMIYPSIELDNLIGGNTYGMFRVSRNGIIDSVWLSHSIKQGIDKEILRFLKNIPVMIPTHRGCKRIPCIYQLAFHFRVKE